MGSDLFAPWHIIILLVAVLLLFGFKRLPGAAQALGQSLHIFRQSVKGLDDQADAGQSVQGSVITPPAAAPLTAPAPTADATQQQLADLQRQLDDLQRRTAAENGAAVTDAAVPQAQQPRQ